MAAENYCMVDKDSNICENICVWDGNPDTWTPPSNYLMLAKATTLTKTWVLNADSTEYILVNSIGDGDTGWTWDGTYLTTNLPQPTVEPLQTQPITGLQTV